MPINYYRALINAPSKVEARHILEHLLEKQLIAGGQITQGDAIYWWEGKPTEKTYFNISTFTRVEHRDEIITEVKKLHSDVTPIIAFFRIDHGNEDFLAWIKANTQS